MPSYSKRSKDNLSECHKDLQTIFNYVIKYWDNTVLDGHRPKEEQDEAFRKGHSTVRWPNSKHNRMPSMAVDSVPFPIEWKNTARMKLYVGFVLGVARRMLDDGEIEHELVSGLDWDKDTFIKDHTFHDHPHFQLKKVSL